MFGNRRVEERESNYAPCEFSPYTHQQLFYNLFMSKQDNENIFMESIKIDQDGLIIAIYNFKRLPDEV